MTYIKSLIAISLAIFFLLIFTPLAHANHSWGGYHWARTNNPFTLKLGDNLTSNWDPYLATASGDWSASIVLDTAIVAGITNPRQCKPTAGRIEVCNASYGKNGWLGIAQIWVSGNHITQGVTKMNDSYFNTATYNSPAWKRLVVCQEVAHTFGLDHQDEVFNNSNLGSCMDYTNNPSGPPNNEHPNQHDYDQLVLIYTHLDNFTTVGQSIGQSTKAAVHASLDNPGEWGKLVRSNGKVAVYERDFGGGQKVLTHVIFAE